MAFKMKGMNFGEGTGSSPLKHDPDGLYAAKKGEEGVKQPKSSDGLKGYQDAKRAELENQKGDGVERNKRTGEILDRDHPDFKYNPKTMHRSMKREEDKTEWDSFANNPNAYISDAPSRIADKVKSWWKS